MGFGVALSEAETGAVGTGADAGWGALSVDEAVGGEGLVLLDPRAELDRSALLLWLAPFPCAEGAPASDC
jgi:hypothetical protein